MRGGDDHQTNYGDYDDGVDDMVKLRAMMDMKTIIVKDDNDHDEVTNIQK